LGLIASATYRVVSLRFPVWFGSRFAMVSLSGLLLLALYAYWLEKNLWLRFILAPICLAYAVNEIHRAPKLIHDFLSAKILCWFGTCSFSLYLWQQPFFEALSYSVLPVIAALVGALLCGSLSFYLFENPLRIYLNKTIASRNTTSVPQGSGLINK
jgi:peptidoglycan/LPS O-acetylase OafA/YrhL